MCAAGMATHVGHNMLQASCELRRLTVGVVLHPHDQVSICRLVMQPPTVRVTLGDCGRGAAVLCRSPPPRHTRCAPCNMSCHAHQNTPWAHSWCQAQAPASHAVVRHGLQPPGATASGVSQQAAVVRAPTQRTSQQTSHSCEHSAATIPCCGAAVNNWHSLPEQHPCTGLPAVVGRRGL